MKKLLTWPEFLKLAREHYNAGGDGIVECWTESDYDEYGHMTEAEALDMFTDRDEIIRDMEADADRYREEAHEEDHAEHDDEEPDPIDYDYITGFGRPADEWRPGDSPWTAPGMSPADFI